MLALRALALVPLIVLALASTARAELDLTHGERFGAAPNEIVDLSSDGNFLVATQGNTVVRWDLSNTEDPELDGTSTALATGTGAPGVNSVALVRDEWVLAGFDSDDSGGGADPSDGVAVLNAETLAVVRTVEFGNPGGEIGNVLTNATGTDRPETPDSIAVSPDTTRAVVAIENDPEVASPTGGKPGFLRIDTSDADPANWDFDLVDLPAAFIAAEGVDAQPEFVDIRDDNTVVGSIQEANRLAIFSVAGTPTELAPTDIVDPGSSNFLADTAEDGTFNFTTNLMRERHPDTVKWIANGTLIALANEGENELIGGTRDISIHEPDGDVVASVGTSFDQATADYGFLDDTRNDAKGSEPEGMDVATIGGTEYLLVLGERSESLSTWDLTFPAAPRLISHVPTGEAPEGIAISAARRFVVVANEESANAIGSPGFFSLHRFVDDSDLPANRLIPRGDGTPYFNVRGLGAGLSHDELAMVDGLPPTRTLMTAVGGRGYAPVWKGADVGAPGAAAEMQDIAPAPAGAGTWVVSPSGTFELARLNASGAAVQVEDVPGTSAPSGVAVTPDGDTVYVSFSNTTTIQRYDVSADTFAELTITAPLGSDRILDLGLAGDGDLLAVVANPNNDVSTAQISRFDGPLADTTLDAADLSVLLTVPVSQSRSSRDITGLALLPGGELWGVSGMQTGGSHYGSADLRKLLELSAPRSVSGPVVTGTAEVGETVTCDEGSWNGANSFTYEWRRDGATIAGATADTYVLTAADGGRRVTCVVLAAGPNAFEVAETPAIVATSGGPVGPEGPVGPAGPEGPAGPQGPKGEDGSVQVTCKVKKRRGGKKKTKVVCEVKDLNGAEGSRVRLQRSGETVGRGRLSSSGRAVLRLSESPKKGAYRLVIGDVKIKLRLR